jgi:murein DD-endopeptidase MepM/ murein hydrolase activator NlpD
MAKILLMLLTLLGSAFVAVPVSEPAIAPTPSVAGTSVIEEPIPEVVPVESNVTLPITVTAFNPWYKEFGTWVDDGRFLGYHAGDDIEMDLADLQARGIVDVPVFAMADGTVQFVGWVNGYGGVMIIVHELDGKTISSLYGHIDKDSATVKVGDQVKKGQQIAVLGEGFTHETDGRRMHLHFALWNGDEVKFPGYVDTKEELVGWLDPYVFFVEHGLLTE